MTSTIKLSTLDQAAPDNYRRHGFVLLFDNKIAIARVTVDRKVHRLVKQLPVLASVIEDGSVSMTLQQISQSSVHHSTDGTLDIEAISRAGMLTSHFSSEHLVSLADSVGQTTSPVFSVQADWLSGGLLLVMYLHSRVADYLGIGTIVREMSEGLGIRTLALEDPQEDATEATDCRAVLSQSNGATSFFAKAVNERLEQQQHTSTPQQHQILHADSVQLDQLTDLMTPSSAAANNRNAILVFKLQNITTLTGMIKSRLSRDNKEAAITDKDILITLLRRAFARARYSPH
nr:hypothetical protein B0A51_09732 [Rachicladosporium sp. CCFEE 5018]